MYQRVVQVNNVQYFDDVPQLVPHSIKSPFRKWCDKHNDLIDHMLEFLLQKLQCIEHDEYNIKIDLRKLQHNLSWYLYKH
jgi:hypothetical protein